MQVATARIRPFLGPTVWQEFTPLAIAHKSVNLGQGFPDWSTPAFVQKCEIDAVQGGFNQYTRSQGHVRLVNAIANKYSPGLQRKVDPLTEILVTVGASQTLYTVLQSLCEEGDEVVVFEPFFDIYVPQIVMAGAKPVYVPLKPPSGKDGEWAVDWSLLEAAITPRTKLMIVNTPHNPTGMVHSEEDLARLSKIVLGHPTMRVISDEVYEHMLFDGKKHRQIAALPGMFDRTITVSSAGKTFSVTGWKVGWAIANKEITKALSTTQQWTSFSISTPHQEAIASAFELAEKPYEGFPTYYAWLADMYEKKRSHLMETLSLVGLKPIVAQGSFFILADTSDIKIPDSYMKEEDGSPAARDYAFCRFLTKEVGVTAIPPSAFYSTDHKEMGKNYARFAFCKEDKTLEEARKRLLSFFKK